MGDPESARPLAAIARKYAANPRETTSLDQLEAALNRRDASLAIEGTLEEMECGKIARLHVRSGADIQIFVMPDPRTVVSVNLTCGPQNNPVRLRVEYQPLPAGADANGLVRSLEVR